MPFWFRLTLSIIFVFPTMVVSGFVTTSLLEPLFRLILPYHSRYKTRYIPWAISFFITFILGFIFLCNNEHIWASGIFLISSNCLGPLIPFFGNFLVPFLESFRNAQYLFWIISSFYFCNVMLYQYQLLAISIGIICLLLFASYMIIRKVITKRLIASLESDDIEKDEVCKGKI